MKIKIKKSSFLEELTKIVGPTNSKQSLADTLSLSTYNNKIKFITTDLDITMISFLETNIEEEGKTLVSMRRILSIVKELPDSEISVEIVKNNLLISCDKIEFKINTFPLEQFPKIEEKKKTSLIKIDPQILEEMLRLVSFCAGSGEANFILGGVMFEFFENDIKVVATDGKRLAFAHKKLPTDQAEIKTKISFILPARAVSEIYKLIKEKQENIYLFIEENKIGFDFKNTQFIARPLEGEFPNYAQYIPAESKDKLIINKKLFLAALRRAAVLSTTDYQGVRLEVKKDCVVVSKQTPQMGEVKESVAAVFSGPALEIGFNPNYLMDVLRNIDDEEVNIEIFGPDKPAVLRKQGYIYLVLPMKL